MYKSLLSSAVLFLSTLSYASLSQDSMSERIQKAYKDLNGKTRVWCEYFGNMQGEILEELETEYIKDSHISTVYQAKNNKFKVMVSINDKGRERVELLTTGLRVEGKLKRNNSVKFNFRGVDYNLSKERGILNLSCALEIAVEDTVNVDTRVLHVNVHPHEDYDLAGRTNERTLELLDIFPSIALLDDYNRKAEGYDAVKYISSKGVNFGVKKFKDPSFEIPGSIPILVAPAGHIKYKVHNDDTIIHYSGGNHNYCIWNNTRRFINAFFRSSTAKRIDFIYHTHAIVNQMGGIIRGISIPRGVFWKSNLLADIFDNMSASQKISYHKAYRDFFINDLAKFKSAYFKTLTIRYQNSVHTIQGGGQLDREINFIYK